MIQDDNKWNMIVGYIYLFSSLLLALQVFFAVSYIYLYSSLLLLFADIFCSVCQRSVYVPACLYVIVCPVFMQKYWKNA